VCVKYSGIYPDRIKYRWKNRKKTDIEKPPPPHGYKIKKGSTHMAATREFVQHALTDRKARDLFDWMLDVFVPDELFFQTLNNNWKIPAPGAVSGTFSP